MNYSRLADIDLSSIVELAAPSPLPNMNFRVHSHSWLVKLSLLFLLSVCISHVSWAVIELDDLEGIFIQKGDASAACNSDVISADPPDILTSNRCIWTIACNPDISPLAASNQNACVWWGANFFENSVWLTNETHYYMFTGSSCPASHPTEINGECVESPREEGPPKPQQCTGPFAGNPINFAVGNKYQEEVDYVGNGPFPLQFRRSYNSRSGNWSFIYQQYLEITATQITLHEETGAGIIFNETSPGIWETESDEPTQLTASGSDWIITNFDDSTETFNVSGQLTEIQNRDGLSITFSYDASNKLTNATHFSGRTLSISHDASDRLSTVIDPMGETISYAYDVNDQLITATYPDETTSGYHG